LKGKPRRIYISQDKWNETKRTIRDGIIKKLSAKQNLSIDIDIAAGIYIYALEEFGKLLLLKDCKKVDERYIIKYRDEFVNHLIKFSEAFDYLQNNNSDVCIVLNDESSHTYESYSWKIFPKELLAEIEARLAIFYIDFTESKNDKDKDDITKIPNIDKNKLNDAINELGSVINNFESSRIYASKYKSGSCE
jgi:hypothetical protein